MMAKGASNCLFLSLLFLLIICSSGTLVCFSYHARGNAAACSTSSRSRTISFLQLNKVSPSQIRVFVADHTVLSTLSNSGVSVDLYLNESLVENLRSFNSSAISWLKTQLLALRPHVHIKSIVVTRINNDSRGQAELVKLLSTLKSIRSILSSFNLDKEVKVSVAFSSSFLHKMKRTTYERDLQRIFGFIKKTGSSVIVEAMIDGEGDQFVESVIEAVSLAATSTLPFNNAPILLTIKSPAVTSPTAAEVAEFSAKVEKSLENNIEIATRVAALYVELVSTMEDFVEKGEVEEQIFLSSRRELLSSVKKTAHDIMIPPSATFPTAPTSTTPVSFLPNNPTPTIVTVPSTTNPVTITPTNPADTTPAPIPTTTPVTVPSTNPNNPTVPITNPVTGTPAAPITVPGAGAGPVTNPVTTYPAPTGGVPVSTPVTNPVAPPATATTNAPVVPGQSWCVARTGALETSLQAALDYACGIGGVDCSQIQQGANCYNPNTLQNHASYAFNSYYQKNPAPTSCDFGGSATIVNTNPSSGSCIYPSSASQSTPTPTATPATTSSTSGAGVPGSVTPPSVLNSSTPGSATTTVFGSDTPPSVNTSTSMSVGLQPSISCYIIPLASFVAGLISLYA